MDLCSVSSLLYPEFTNQHLIRHLESSYGFDNNKKLLENIHLFCKPLSSDICLIEGINLNSCGINSAYKKDTVPFHPPSHPPILQDIKYF